MVCRAGLKNYACKRSALDTDNIPAFLYDEEKTGIICNKKDIRYFVVRCLIKAYLATFSYVSADIWKDDGVKIFIFELCQLISLLLR